MHRNEIKGVSNSERSIRDMAWWETNERILGVRKQNKRTVMHKNKIKGMDN
jgi:hypothetical protein